MPAVISILHIAAAILSLVELAIVAYLISPFSHGFAVLTPGIFSFLMFNTIWSLLVLAYVALGPRFSPDFFHANIALVIEWITTIFWFSGAVAFVDYFHLLTADYICSWVGNCSSYRAGIVFGFAIWLLFLGISMLDTIEFRRSRGHRTSATPVKPYVAA